MSLHLGASNGAVAETVLLPGDPLRARFAAETYLENPVCYSEVRGMFGYTGTYRGKRVSIQGTGMGVPSISIYAHELIQEYGAKRLIRVGTCGSLQEDIGLGELVLAMTASTDSAVNRARFGHATFAPCADFALLLAALKSAEQRKLPLHVGGVFTSDSFYHVDPDYWRGWAAYGVLAIEMETAALYTLAAQHGVEALSILTVSDSLVDGSSAPAEIRQKGYGDMFELALSI